MVNKPLIRPYFLGGVALGGVARIPLISAIFHFFVNIRYMLLTFLPQGTTNKLHKQTTHEPTVPLQYYN